METTIKVRSQGFLTLPAELRQKYGIKTGDTFRLVDLDGVFILTPMVPIVPELFTFDHKKYDEPCYPGRYRQAI